MAVSQFAYAIKHTIYVGNEWYDVGKQVKNFVSMQVIHFVNGGDVVPHVLLEKEWLNTEDH